MIAEGSVVPSEVTNAWTNWSRAILILILIWPRFNFRPNDIIDNTFVNICYNKNRDYFNYGSNSNLFIYCLG
jgi:hypothetical protein